ncbi:MAG: flagellar hook basal-body protein [Nitrospirae bacterium]|nr:flagellar hook basal-body protein [Nitrospirota bacterium]
MHKGIYIALSGAVLKYAQMEILSHNIANADTIGYKRDDVSFKDYLIPQDIVNNQPDGRAMSYFSKFRIDMSSGVHVKTGSLLDVAIEGNGFIVLEGNRYTRRGDFKKDREGYLTTQNGIKVMGQKGPIKLPEGEVEISQSGDISVNGNKIDSLKIVDFKQTEDITKAGGDIFFSKGRPVNAKAIVKQGYVEKSNVGVVKEMVGMIEMLREFEMFQKAIQYFDEAQGKVTNEIGRA